MAHARRNAITKADAEQAAETADQDGFEQKLAQDISIAGADGLAHADLAGALGDRDQHDVHDADAAHE